MTVDDHYLELALRIERHLPGFIDAYFGSQELKDRVDGEPVRDPAALVADASALRDEIDAGDLEPQRARWLRAQALALHTVALRVAGDTFGYLEELELCYGVVPTREPEASFEAAHRELNELLPGDGDLAARYAEWREESVPVEDQVTVLVSLSEELRERVRELFGLPAGERVEYETAAGQPWAGFNYYEGRLRSRVAINTDIPLPRSEFGPFVAHESYPGHHTEHSSKEARFVIECGQREQTVILTAAPESIISEGLAEFGAELLFDDIHELTSDHLAQVGVDYDPELGRKVTTARDALGGVPTNVALMLHEDGVSPEEARAYAQRWSLATEARVDRMFDFLMDPVWRTYLPSYHEGRRLCEVFVADDPARFKRLLTEQLTPADLGPSSAAA